MTGRISFIGAGPGAADLITVRGARRIGEADVVIWSASLVTPECVREHAGAEAELVDSTRLTPEDAVEIYRRAERDGLRVVRMHSGDPALWGTVQEQYDACVRMNLEVEIVPGVAEFSAAAASVGRELTSLARSVVVTRLEGGTTSTSSGERVREFLEHGTTMALSASAARAGQLVEELRAGGYTDDVPVVIAYKVTWPDELVLRTTLGELEDTVKQHKLWRHALFLVGRALTEEDTRSHRYGKGHSPTSRRPAPTTRRSSSAERGPARRSSRPRPEGDPGSRTAVERTEARRHGARTAPEPETTAPQPRGEEARAQPDSDVAWWTVRDWQQSARGAARIAAARTATRRAPQPDLFVQEQPAEGRADGVTITVQEVVAAAMRTGTEAVDSGGATEPGQDVARSVIEATGEQQDAESTTEPTERTATAEPVAAQQDPGVASAASEDGSARAEAASKSRGKAKSGSTKQHGTKSSGTKSTGTKSAGAKSTGAKSSGTKSGSKSGSAASGKRDRAASESASEDPGRSGDGTTRS